MRSRFWDCWFERTAETGWSLSEEEEEEEDLYLGSERRDAMGRRVGGFCWERNF